MHHNIIIRSKINFPCTNKRKDYNIKHYSVPRIIIQKDPLTRTQFTTWKTFCLQMDDDNART